MAKKRKRSKSDWWLLALSLLAVVLAGILGLITIFGPGRSAYVRQAADKGAIQWPENLTSRTAKLLRDIATEAPAKVDEQPNKTDEKDDEEKAEDEPAAPAPKLYAIEPVGTVPFIGKGTERPPVPVYTQQQAFDMIYAFRASLRAAFYSK